MTDPNTTAQPEQPRTVVAELREYLEDALSGSTLGMVEIAVRLSPEAYRLVETIWARASLRDDPQTIPDAYLPDWRVQILTSAIRRAVVTRWEDGS